MDIQAFRNYYDTYYEQLCCFLNFYTHDVAVIEDVIQEVFLKLWENKDCIEITYIKTYLFYLSEILHKTPEEVSWSDLREFVRWLQREKILSDRTINHCISQLRFFTLYVLHKPWDPTQLPMRKFDSYLPLYLNYIRKINCYHVFCTFPQLFRLYFYLTIFSPQHPRQIHLLFRPQDHISKAWGVLAEHDEGHKDCQEAGLRAVFQEGREDEGGGDQDRA